VTDYRQKSNRILKCALAIALLGVPAFWLTRGPTSSLAFACSALIGLGSLWALARGIDILGQGKTHWLKGFGFVVRFLVYALVLSAIMKVYPDRSFELFWGIFLPILAIGLETLIAYYQDART
jgi:hypothetical protein